MRPRDRKRAVIGMRFLSPKSPVWITAEASRTPRKSQPHPSRNPKMRQRGLRFHRDKNSLGNARRARARMKAVAASAFRRDAIVGETRPSSRKSRIAREHPRMLGILTGDLMEGTVMLEQTTGRDHRPVRVDLLGRLVTLGAAPPNFATARVPPIKRGPIGTAVRVMTGASRTKRPAEPGGRRGVGNVVVMMNATRRGNHLLVHIGREAKGTGLVQRRRRM